jgi:hypothetical protein
MTPSLKFINKSNITNLTYVLEMVVHVCTVYTVTHLFVPVCDFLRMPFFSSQFYKNILSIL